jgi:transposase
MSKQRYTPEFKDEAVRQVTDKGHSVQEVAARLGVSLHSLYKWVKSASPNKEEKRSL